MRVQFYKREQTALALDEAPATLSRIVKIWQAARGARAVPAQADLSLEELRPSLGNLALIDVEAPFRARYVLVGPNLVKLLGRDPTGSYLDSVYPPGIYKEAAAAIADAVLLTEPTLHRCEHRLLGRVFGYYRLLLPLHGGGGRPRRVLLAIVPLSPDLTRASQWQAAAARVTALEARLDRVELAWRGSLPAEEIFSDEDVVFV